MINNIIILHTFKEISAIKAIKFILANFNLIKNCMSLNLPYNNLLALKSFNDIFHDFALKIKHL